MKYWSTMRPSRKFAVIGRLDDLARGLGHETAHGGELANLLGRAARAGVGHDVDRVEDSARCCSLPVSGSTIFSLPMPFIISSVTCVGDAGPDVDDLVVALAVGDQAFLVLLDDALDLLPAPRSRSDLLRVRDDHVVHADRDAGARRVARSRACAGGRRGGRSPCCGACAVADVDEVAESAFLSSVLLTSSNGSPSGSDLGR